MRNASSILLLCVALAVAPCAFGENVTLSDQPDKQQESVRRILAMGGDWEAPTKTLLIGFIGKKFTNETFVLLDPLVDVQILYFENVPAKDSALTHCKNLREIRQLQLQSCSFTGAGLKHFAKAKKLNRLFIEDTPITDDGLSSIAMLVNLELLDITCVNTPTKITADGLRKLRTLIKLKQLCIAMPHATQEMENGLRVLLPQCEHVHLVPWQTTQDNGASGTTAID